MWWYWQFWRVLVRYLVECLFTGIGLTFLSWGDGFCRERPPREIATVVRSHQGYLTISMTGDVDHVTWLRRRMSGISLSFLSPLEGSQCVRADLQTGTYSPLLWGWVICRSYSEFLCAADVFILHYLFISVWYTLGYNPIMLYFSCSGCSLGGIFHLAFVSLWHTPIIVCVYVCVWHFLTFCPRKTLQDHLFYFLA